MKELEDGGVRISFRRKHFNPSAMFWIGAGYHEDFQELDLSGTDVTDEDIERLRDSAGFHLVHLRVLDLRETDVSEEAVDELQKVIPDCQIIRSPDQVSLGSESVWEAVSLPRLKD